MGARLRLLTVWMPKRVVSAELEKIYDATVDTLAELLRSHAPDAQVEVTGVDLKALRTVEEKRLAMANRQTVLVDALVGALGQEKAVPLGREALFAVGRRLGEGARERLGVGSSRSDMMAAARVMYRVLGIDFTVQWQNQSEATVTINRCALAKKYSDLTCSILSAVDEGVVKGLNPNATMKFTRHMTSGCETCTAKIQVNGGTRS